MSAITFFQPEHSLKKAPLPSLQSDDCGKIYADVPLSFFSSIEDLKIYVRHLKDLGVNVLLILPHFLPALSPYVVKSYEEPCALFGTWENFAQFMQFVADLGMDRMIDIPFNHADWEAHNLKREWFIEHENDGVEAGADDVDADNNRIRVNWGAYILDNANEELQNYWLEKVIYPHIEKYNVNSIRIDAAWGLDLSGLKRIIGETNKKYPHVWFLAENLGMAPLIELAESGMAAGADRFFNNIYWYTGGRYIPSDIYKLYKRSNGVPTCSIFSSHDTLMPAMKSYAKLRAEEVKGLNDKAIVRKFVEYENKHSLEQLSPAEVNGIMKLMQADWSLMALMSSDVMFAAGSEKGLFERINVLASDAESFAKGIDSDLPAFMAKIVNIKNSSKVFCREGVMIPIGQWQPDESGLKGFVKTCADNLQCLVCVNTGPHNALTLELPQRITGGKNFRFYSSENVFETEQIESTISLQPSQIIIISCERNL